MLIIGEKIHILNPVVHNALETRDMDPIVDLALKQKAAGADAIDINLGPGRRTGKMLPEIIKAIQEKMEIDLFLPADASEFATAMNICRGRTTINAATADPKNLTRVMAAADCFNADIVVLLTRTGCLPRSVDEWCVMAEDVLETAEKNNFSVDKIYLDPVLRTRFDPTAPGIGSAAMELGPVLEAIHFMGKLRECGIRTIGGLSNISCHLPQGSRSPLHCSVLKLLWAAGLSAVILNPLDSRLMDMVRARNPENFTMKIQEMFACTHNGLDCCAE